jgi:phage baseplate assembly protein W
MASISGIDPNTTTLDSYGRDILFIDDFQITAKGDYATVDGQENLRRAILRRLLVRAGEYKLNPNYGVGVSAYVKKAQTKANLDSLRHAIVDQLSRERRIEKVLSVDVQATFFDSQPGVVIVVRCLAIGRNIEFSPFNFTAKGVA